MADDIDEIEDVEFSALERKRLRRMLNEDRNARYFKTTLKVWSITIGTLMSIFVAVELLIEKFVGRLWK